MMRKICLHWTAGTYAQTEADTRSYHFTVGPDGAVSAGKFAPEANIPPLCSGRYAAHCGGGNSWCIGVALRGMAGYQRPERLGKAPVTRPQGEGAWSLTAELCRTYAIPVTPDTVFTHWEFGKRHPASGSAGKIDIVHLPYAPDVQAADIGDYIRGKVRWYLSR